MVTDLADPDDALVAKYRTVCRNALQRLTADLPTNDAARQAAYEKIRQSNEAFIRNNQGKFGDGVSAALRAVVEEVIADDGRRGLCPAEAAAAENPPPSPAESEGPRQSVDRQPPDQRPWLLGGIAGFGVAVLGAVALWLVGVLGSPATERQREFDAKFAKSLPKVEIAAQFLEKVEQEVIRRQKEDGAAMAAQTAKSFAPLVKLLPEMAKDIPKQMPRPTTVLIKANETGYKIVFRSALCTTVEFARPGLVDPQRKTESLGCEFFGVWNEPGAKF